MASDLSIRLGKKIRDLRRARGWRQIDLAAHAELSKTHVCELETGKREVGLNTLERIADALEVQASEMLKAIGR
jgi:XRE family aerobic/anaerobic benzoate catabolism transcriptional regulator